jgi:hypothetical protein
MTHQAGHWCPLITWSQRHYDRNTPNPALTESLSYGKMSVCTEQTFALESRQTWPRDAARLPARGHLLCEQLTDYGRKFIKETAPVDPGTEKWRANVV